FVAGRYSQFAIARNLAPPLRQRRLASARILAGHRPMVRRTSASAFTNPSPAPSPACSNLQKPMAPYRGFDIMSAFIQGIARGKSCCFRPMRNSEGEHEVPREARDISDRAGAPLALSLRRLIPLRCLMPPVASLPVHG